MNIRFDTLEAWQKYARAIDERVKRLQDSIHERGWKLAASVEIPHHLCCLHNASIDDDLQGWCYRNPHRLKVAKQAAHIVNDWTASDLGRRLVQKAWEQFCRGQGWGQYAEKPVQRRD